MMRVAGGEVVGREQRLTTAADWLVRLRDPAISPVEIGEWVAWCDASAENKQAFAEIEALWGKAAGIPEKPISAAALAGDQELGFGVANAGTRRVVRWPLRRLTSLLAAAAVAAVAVIGLMWALDRFSPLFRGDVIVATETGVSRELELPDGSVVTIAAGSRLSTRYSDIERTVLLERGEAFFRVEKDAQRAFVVHALDATITAVGTAFNVRADGGVVRVAVTEGIVDVDQSAAADAAIAGGSSELSGGERQGGVRLTAGRQVTLSRIDVDPVITSVDVAQATSWMSGTLQFVNEPLSSVLATVNRYSQTPIALANPSLGDYRYTGTMVGERVDEWLTGLPDIFPVALRAHSGETGTALVIEAASE